MRYILSIIIIVVIPDFLTGQSVSENISGKVSYISSQNIYVKFQSTEGIFPGDTLYTSSNGKLIPVLKVINLSSISCICEPISNANFTVNKEIVGIKKIKLITNQKKISENKSDETPEPELPSTSTIDKPNQEKLKQKIRGSLTASSYYDFSNTNSPNSNRLQYTLSLNARNLSNSRFSVESYMSFRHKIGDWKEVESNIFNALKIYNLSLIYDLNSTTQFIIGRKINPKIASIGPIDGLQLEKTINKFSLGFIVGYRPDYKDFGFNNKLFQYGTYMAFNTKNNNKFSESSIAFMQQMNHSKTDRRFIYFQHSNSLIKNFNFFSFIEVDLFKNRTDSLNNDNNKNVFDPTGIYLSLRYRITDNLSISGSYDARKNVIYYETYKSYIDRILENEIRKGYSLRTNFRIYKNLNLGLQSSYRFLKSDLNHSKNIHSYLTLSQIPFLNMSITLTGTYLNSSYINGKIIGVTASQSFFQGKIQSSLGYNYVNNELPESIDIVNQNIGSANLSIQFLKKMYFSVFYEGTFEKTNHYNRIFLQVRKRF